MSFPADFRLHCWRLTAAASGNRELMSEKIELPEIMKFRYNETGFSVTAWERVEFDRRLFGRRFLRGAADGVRRRRPGGRDDGAPKFRNRGLRSPGVMDFIFRRPEYNFKK
jgi:hypothetical protein